MNSSVIVFPGSNCDRDIAVALEKLKFHNKMVWHKDMDLPKSDIVRTTLNKMTSNNAYNDDTMPGNLSRDMGIKRKQFMPGVVDYMAKGGRAGHKSGGKVKGCGKALRGFGKAMKGKK